jgi:hypothetical protein
MIERAFSAECPTGSSVGSAMPTGARFTSTDIPAVRSIELLISRH